MLEQHEQGELAASLGELKAYLRITTNDEDALLTAMLMSAASLCEQFVGQWLIERDARETMAASGVWTRLTARPVIAILGVEAVDGAGVATALSADAYAIDIDASGDGWVRVPDAGGARIVRVQYRAGMAAQVSSLPDAIRQGIIRLAAEQHAGRVDGNASPPAVVSALWRPWRRMRLN